MCDTKAMPATMNSMRRCPPAANRLLFVACVEVAHGRVVMSLLAGGLQPAAADEAARGFELYMSECSKCHGSMDVADSAGGRQPPVHMAFAGQAVERSCSARSDLCEGAIPELAFALPFGPNLDGILGRPAGTVAGYEYSKAFMAAFTGVTWNAVMLDEYIADSQLLGAGHPHVLPSAGRGDTAV